MQGNQSLYSILGSLYDSHMLAQMPLPTDRQSQFGGMPFGRQPLQIISSGSARAPAPQQQQSGEGGLAGLIMAGGSLFQKGGALQDMFSPTTATGNNFELMKSLGASTGTKSESDLFRTLGSLESASVQSPGMGSWFSSMFR
jgi:hypothetical protein